MIMTNEGALSKRCCGPMPCGKLNVKAPPERRCVGKDCMAWTWKLPYTSEEYGSCGLAGQPDLDTDP